MKNSLSSTGITFLIHNHKCGGNSIEKALIETGIKYIKTDTISIDEDSPIYRRIMDERSPEPMLIFGHPDRIRQSENSEKNAEFFRHLYWTSRVICPSRRPISLTISWLEYVRVRLINFTMGREEKYNQNPDSVAKYRFLWEQYSGYQLEAAVANDFEHPYSSPAENVARWLRIVTDHTIYHFIQSYNLFFPINGEILAAAKNNVRRRLPLDRLIESGQFFIYDSQRYSKVAVQTLATEISPKFVDFLTLERLNISENSLGSLSEIELGNLQAEQDKVSDLDSQIYARAV